MNVPGLTSVAELDPGETLLDACSKRQRDQQQQSRQGESRMGQQTEALLVDIMITARHHEPGPSFSIALCLHGERSGPVLFSLCPPLQTWGETRVSWGGAIVSTCMCVHECVCSLI